MPVGSCEGTGRVGPVSLDFTCKRYVERHWFLFGRRIILGGAYMFVWSHACLVGMLIPQVT